MIWPNCISARVGLLGFIGRAADSNTTLLASRGLGSTEPLVDSARGNWIPDFQNDIILIYDCYTLVYPTAAAASDTREEDKFTCTTIIMKYCQTKTSDGYMISHAN